ncbi:MAG: hypothetical protein V6Z81_07555 [Parvularculales bacterium]
MTTLTRLSIALMMAFALSGPAVFTAPAAHAGDWGCAFGVGDCEIPGEPRRDYPVPTVDDENWGDTL